MPRETIETQTDDHKERPTAWWVYAIAIIAFLAGLIGNWYFWISFVKHYSR